MGWDIFQKFFIPWDGMIFKIFHPIPSHGTSHSSNIVLKKYNFLRHLPVRRTLSVIKLFITPWDNSEQLFSWFKNEALKLNVNYCINYFHIYADGPRELYKTELCIWTSGSVN